MTGDKIKVKLFVLFIVLVISANAGAETKLPGRIVSLKPSITDTIYALGMGKALVGVTKYCDVPKGKRRPETAADYTRPYTERIIALRPDIVLGSEENSSRRSIDALKRAGIEVRLFPFTTLEESISSIQGIADLLGRQSEGRLLAQRIEAELGSLARRFNSNNPIKAVIVWGLRPMIVAGPGSYMDEAIGYIGLANAVGDRGVRYPKVGLEQLIAFDPDIIIDLSMDVKEATAQSRPWDGVKTIKAVREGRVIAMDPALFRAGPNIPNALEKLANEIYSSESHPEQNLPTGRQVKDPVDSTGFFAYGSE